MPRLIAAVMKDPRSLSTDKLLHPLPATAPRVLVAGRAYSCCRSTKDFASRGEERAKSRAISCTWPQRIHVLVAPQRMSALGTQTIVMRIVHARDENNNTCTSIHTNQRIIDKHVYVCVRSGVVVGSVGHTPSSFISSLHANMQTCKPTCMQERTLDFFVSFS